MTRRAPVIVVGAGFSGLAAACHLRAAGHEVLVLETGDRPGGRAGLVEHRGYRFDTGPTVVTVLDVLAQPFRAVGTDIGELCTLLPVDPVYRAHFHDGSSFALPADTGAATAAIDRFAGPAEARAYQQFLRWIGELHAAELTQFIDRDVRSVLTLAADAGALARLVRLGAFRSWYSTVSRLFADERLRRLFSFQALYAGVSPIEALGLLAVIAHMDTVQGVYAPLGGTAALAEGLATAAAKAGVELAYGTPAAAVTARPKPAVRLGDGTTVDASAVVVTADLPVAYDELLGVAPPRRVDRAVAAPSCVVWHLATSGPLPAGSAHHNVHFGQAWDDAFDEILGRPGRPATDPSRFVTIASLSDPTAAPPGGHGLFVLEPVPNLSADVDWERETPRLTDRMLAWADGAGYPMRGAELVTVVDPPAWRHQGAAHGTPFSFAHRFRQSGPFRPAPEDRRLPGVVFAGAGTRPGLGLPLVTISGRIAAERAHHFVVQQGKSA
ncbi:MAG: phytoene desaturase family protein [Acidimicrobiales bacterium]